MPVVECFLVGICEDKVGFRNMLECIGGPRDVGVLIRMELESELPIRFFYGHSIGVPGDSEHLVVVCDGQNALAFLVFFLVFVRHR